MKDNSSNLSNSQKSNSDFNWGFYISLIVVIYTIINRYLSKQICYHSWDLYSNIVLIFSIVCVLCIVLYKLKILKSDDFLMTVVTFLGLSIFPNLYWTVDIVRNWNERSVEVNSISTNCELSYFHGISPGQSYKDVCSIMGDPVDYVDMSDEYNSIIDNNDKEAVHSMKFVTDEGSLLCYWDGNLFNNIWHVKFKPSYSIALNDFLHGIDLDKYNIRDKVYRVNVINHKETIFVISLKNGVIRYISYINNKKVL